MDVFDLSPGALFLVLAIPMLLVGGVWMLRHRPGTDDESADWRYRDH